MEQATHKLRIAVNEIMEFEESGTRWKLFDVDSLAALGILGTGYLAWGAEGSKLFGKSRVHFIHDPPYEGEAHNNSTTQKDGKTVKIDIPFPPMTENDRNTCGRIMQCLGNGWGLVFCQSEALGAWRHSMTRDGGKWMRSQYWRKTDAAPQFTGDRPGQPGEAIASAWYGEAPGAFEEPGLGIATAWFGKDRSHWNGKGRAGFYEFSRTPSDTKLHPTQKPLKLMLELVELFTNPGDIVVDMYAGSGTTGAACLRLGRRFIGFERYPPYFESAMERLTAEAHLLSHEQAAEDAASGQSSLF